MMLKKVLIVNLVSKDFLYISTPTMILSAAFTIILPLTFKVAVCDVAPALFFAVQVYVPLCLYPTELIVSIDVLVPNDAVVRPGSEEIMSPFRAQERVRGSSPLRTIQTSCANSPSSTTSLPNVSGSKIGGSKRKKVQSYHVSYAIDIEERLYGKL